MARHSALTQHGHVVSCVAGACPTLDAPVSVYADTLMSLRPASLATPSQNQIETQEWATNGADLFGKREQRTAIT